MIPYWLAWLFGADRGKGPQTVEVWPRPDNWHQLEADGMTPAERPILLPRGGSGTAPAKPRPKTPAEVTAAATDWAVRRFNEEIHDNLESLPYELPLPEMADADEVAARLGEAGWSCELAVRESAFGTTPPLGHPPYPVLVVRRTTPKPCWWCRGDGRSSDGSMPCQLCDGQTVRPKGAA
jgi:hypothetical protein